MALDPHSIHNLIVFVVNGEVDEAHHGDRLTLVSTTVTLWGFMDNRVITSWGSNTNTAAYWIKGLTIALLIMSSHSYGVS